VLDGEIDIGDDVPIALGDNRSRAPGSDELGGDIHGVLCQGEQGCGRLGFHAHRASLPWATGSRPDRAARAGSTTASPSWPG